MSLNQIIKTHKSKWLKEIDQMREMILANLVMVSQIPAPTFKEENRSEFILNRYIESGLTITDRDEVNNVIGIMEGKTSKKKILLSAHMDSLFKETDNHNIKVHMDYLQGAGVADNGIGLATLITLPEIISKLGIEFDSDIVFLATTQSLGRGDLAGTRYFMDNKDMNIDFYVGVKGVQLGRIDYFSLSNVRCDVKYDLNIDEASVWGELGHTNAILVVNDLMNGLLAIPIPQRPKSLLNIGLIAGGEAYDKISSAASLSLEIRSEQDKITDDLMNSVQEVCREVGMKHNIEIVPEFFGRQHAAGLKLNHPLVSTTVDILEALECPLKLRPSSGDITVPLSNGIPSITLGITTGKKSTLPNGLIYLEPISRGIVQLLLLLYAIDKGLCNETR